MRPIFGTAYNVTIPRPPPIPPPDAIKDIVAIERAGPNVHAAASTVMPAICESTTTVTAAVLRLAMPNIKSPAP